MKDRRLRRFWRLFQLAAVCLAGTVSFSWTAHAPATAAVQLFTGVPYKITFYWTVVPHKIAPDEPMIPVVDTKLQLIGWGPEWLIRQIAVEGSGYLPSGQLVNLACDCPFPDSRFSKVNTENAPWGLDARSQPLMPFQSIAVDPDVIPLGTTVFIPAFQGLELPDGRRHTGCFIANDTGYGIQKEHIDIFSGTKENYEFMIKKLESDRTFLYPSSDDCPLII